MIHIPGYKIVRTLGRGGMASVYLAVQESFEREVALKVMNPTLAKDPKFTARFLQEARVVSRLAHPNIVTVYDVGVQGVHHYLSMEYVPGTDLTQKRGSLTPPQTLRVIRDVAKALEYAGKKGYVHRDIKPENIMLHEDDGRAVLMDFGIACLADTRSGMTEAGMTIGTPHFMSPEQAKGRTVDTRSDIYSLGAVLFFLLAGHCPYDGDSAVAIGIRHLEEDLPRLPGPLRVLQPLVDRSMAKDPDQRYQTGVELIAAIDEVTDEDIEAIQLASKHYRAQIAAGRIQAPEPPSVPRSRTQAPSLVTTITTVAMDALRGRRAKPASKRKPERAAAAAEASKPHRTEERAAEPAEADAPEAKEGRQAWLWALAASVALLLTGGVYYGDYLPAEAAGALDRAMTKGAEVGDWVAAVELPELDELRLPAFLAGQRVKSLPSEEEPQAGEESAPTLSAGVGHKLEVEQDSEADHSASAETGREVPEAPATSDKGLDPEPSEPRVRTALDEHYDRIRGALDTRDLDEAQVHFAALHSRFPDGSESAEIADDGDYQALREFLNRAREAQRYIELGDERVSGDALTLPAEANALQAYQRALQVDPGNPLAEAGFKKIVERYVELAERNLNSGRRSYAAELARRGLSVDSEHKGLRELLARASGEDEQASVDRLKSRAERQMASENHLDPPGESAYHIYQRMLELDPANAEAKRGLSRIERELVIRIETQINRDEFEDAREVLLAAQEAYGNSRRLEAARAALEDAVEADFIARQPRISHLLVSSQPADSIGEKQSETLRLERTLHVGFSYENFESDNSVVQAMLYDESRRAQIAKIPVVVSGAEGVRFFQIQRPVGGFEEGRYDIDLVLGDDRLNTLSFEVELAQD